MAPKREESWYSVLHDEDGETKPCERDAWLDYVVLPDVDQGTWAMDHCSLKPHNIVVDSDYNITG